RSTQLVTSSPLLLLARARPRSPPRNCRYLPTSTMNQCQRQRTSQPAAVVVPPKKSPQLFAPTKRSMSGTHPEDPSNGKGEEHPQQQQQQHSRAVQAEDRQRIAERQRQAFEFFSQTLQIYGVEELIFCFNGGKDCTVLLDLLMRYLRQEGISSSDIPMLYIKSGDSFAEIDDFVERCVASYRVKLVEYEGSLKEALTHMAADMPRIQAVFVGSRNTDPYCETLAPMQPTDIDWPPMMRLNPLLEWSYHDVWNYIHLNDVPYCSLYDKGYTSVGNRCNTIPNPHLRRPSDSQRDNCDCITDSDCDPAESGGYRPAWELEDPSLERAGRLPRK
ncbi:hypothetical protein KR038_001470, partial [Drosophila bunnanda]